MDMKKQLQCTVAAMLAAVLLFCALPLPASASSQIQTDSRITIRFDPNGGQGRIPDPLSGLQGLLLNIPDTRLDAPQDTDSLRFVGWSVLPTAIVPDYRPGDPIFLTRSGTLYAVYLRERTGTAASPSPAAASLPDTRSAYTLASGEHCRYMDGGSDGLFHPAQSLSRAELAQILYQLMEDRPLTMASFSDVAQDAWYTLAVGTVADLGLLKGDGDGSFRPDQPVTRAETADALAQLIPSGGESKTFADVSPVHPSAAAISAVGGFGLFSGDQNGNFNPDAPLLRSEAAVVLNKLTGRAPDLNTLREHPNARYFPDVPTTHWAYTQIMEASISHGHTQTETGEERWTDMQDIPTVLSDGFHRIGGWLYLVRDGHFVRSETAGYLTFDAEGRYTTGDPSLDLQLNALTDSLTTPSMARDEKLRALYNYVRDNFTYLKRPLVDKDQTGWEPEYASAFLSMGKGNCFSFSALFCLLAREVGQPAYPVVGKLGKNASPHGWVEMELDGAVYMFDPQLEWRYLHDYGKSGYDLFKVLPQDARFIYAR